MAEWTTPDAVHSFCGESFGKNAVNTIDDNTETYWLHAVTCFHWIIFDMGETKTITQIRIYQSDIPTRRWSLNLGLCVYVGDNPADLGDPVWEGVLDATGWQESGEFSKNGRYVKLVSKSNDSNQYMYEFDAYAEAVAPPIVPVGGNVQQARVLEIIAAKHNKIKPFSSRFPKFKPRLVA